MKLGPTKVTLVTMRFHAFFFRLPLCRTLNISSSATGRTWRSIYQSVLLQAIQNDAAPTVSLCSSSMHTGAQTVTFGKGTSHLPAFCLRFCFMVLLRTFALSTCTVTTDSFSQESATWIGSLCCQSYRIYVQRQVHTCSLSRRYAGSAL